MEQHPTHHKGEHHEDEEHDEEADMRMAVAINAVIAAASLASGMGSKSSAAISEFIHDGSDALTHYFDLQGHASESQRRAIIARRISAAAIMSIAGYYSYRTGVDSFDFSDSSTNDAALAVAAVAAGANMYIHRRLDHHHVDEGDDSKLNLAASQVHAKVDAYVSPILFTGIATSRFTEFDNADDIAAFVGSAATFVGNMKPSIQAFTTRLPGRREALENDL